MPFGQRFWNWKSMGTLPVANCVIRAGNLPKSNIRSMSSPSSQAHCHRVWEIRTRRPRRIWENRVWKIRIRYNNEAVCVFVGRDDTGTGRFACVRSIAGDLKKDISGSDKRFSFCYPPDQPGSRHLAVFEAPIDALSHATLQKLEGWQWNGYRLSLGGTSHVALVAFLERHPEITRVALYLDNDLAGRVNARKIKSLLKSDQRFSKIRVSVNPPRGVKDYNEKLQRTLQTIREEKHASRQKQAAVSI